MIRVAVIGAGVSGLVAAYRLRQSLGPDADIVVIERSTRVGGKLRSVELASGPVDIGAEAFIARRPEVPRLLEELGIGDQLVVPSAARPLIRSGGSLHPLPTGTLMGIPSDSGSVRGLVDLDTCRRIDAEATRTLEWAEGSDISVGELVADRFGMQVVSRSVDPLLGGVYSGSAMSIGVRAALPTLAAALDRGAESLTAAVATALPAAAPGPVFGGLRDGYASLLRALTDAAGATVLADTVATGLRRSGRRWLLENVGEFDGVVVTTPAPDASALLGSIAPALKSIDIASSVLVAMSFVGAELPDNSGVLVATDEVGSGGERLRAKAFTLSSRKWPHLAERPGDIVRASFGRFGDDAVVELSDDDLVRIAQEDLREVLGTEVSPSETVVQRWRGGLPQYAPGHLDRVAEIEASLSAVDGLEVAGAYLRGVGVPACIASATAAANRLVTALT